jgi:hypothetical protein
MGLRPESVGANYPYTPMLVGNAWVVFNCHTGLVAGCEVGNGKYRPRVWANAAGALNFIDLLLSRVYLPPHLVGEILWQEYPAPEPAEPPVQKTWAPVRFPTRADKIKAIAEAAGFIGMPTTPSDNYRILRAVENLLAGR